MDQGVLLDLQSLSVGEEVSVLWVKVAEGDSGDCFVDEENVVGVVGSGNVPAVATGEKRGIVFLVKGHYDPTH